MRVRRDFKLLLLGGIGCCGLVPAVFVLLFPGLEAVPVFVGTFVAVLFLGSTAAVAMAFRSSRDLSTLVMLTYLTKVSLACGMLFLVPASVLGGASFGWGVLIGALSYQAVVLVWYMRRGVGVR